MLLQVIVVLAAGLHFEGQGPADPPVLQLLES